MFWVCSCIISCCGVIVIVGIAVQAGIIQAAEKCVCENGGAIYNPVTQKCVAGSPSYTCETIKQHQDFIALYSLHTLFLQFLVALRVCMVANWRKRKCLLQCKLNMWQLRSELLPWILNKELIMQN